MMNFATMNAMTTAEIKHRMDNLAKLLDNGMIDPEPWHEYYDEYRYLEEILDERYRAENQVPFDAFYEKHIKGKSWEEIDPEAWSFYSDWHKDMYGYRPRKI